MIYVLLIVTILLSGFFSGLEIAYLSSNRLRIEIERNRGGLIGRVLSMLFRHPDRFITTMLVGNNAVLVVYGLLMAALIDPFLNLYLPKGGWVILANALISTFVIVILGEYLPKAAMRRTPNRSMLRLSLPVSLFYIVLYPFTMICTGITKMFLLIMKPKGYSVELNKRLSTVDLDHYLSLNRSENGTPGELETEVKIIQNALDFSHVQARDCMIPRNEIVACDINTDIEVLKKRFVETGLTKIVVYRDNIDKVVGYIHSAEMFKGLGWQKRLNTTLFVPESMYGHKLMQTLMQRKKSIAIVVDELGGTAGLVTLEDLVEEIFGDIKDEHDTNQIIAKKEADGTYLLSGRLEIDDANELFNLELPENDEYMTVAGFILAAHPHIPDSGEVVNIGRYSFKILRSTDTRIELVKLTLSEVV